MSKNFLLTVVVGIAALGVFSYFIFGFYPGTPDTSTANKSIEGAADTNSNTAPQATELKIEDIKKGEGPEVKSGDTVEIHYKGTLTNGKKFDSSYDRGTPFETKIGVGQVIEGWDKGVVGMQVGGKRKLTIPPSMGYGDRAAGEIPPNSTLIFEVELLGIK
jgi:peptidylprolyl isomerase